MIRFIFAAFTYFVVTFSDAQIFYFENYPVAEGLVQSNVRCMVQDQQAKIWLGTDAGISRFDGKVFQNFTVNEGLADNAVSAMICDHSGSVWIGYNSGGVNRFRDNKFELSGSGVFPRGKKVLWIYEDSKHSIWISFEGFGVFCIPDPDADLRGSHAYTVFKSKEGLSSLVFDILESKKGDLYFVTDVGVKHFLSSENRFEFFKVKELEGIEITKMLEDEDGNFWFGLYLGGPGILAKLDTKTGKVTTRMLPSFISCLMKDKNGIIWASTWGNGILKFDIKKNEFREFNARNGFNSEKNYCLLKDREGNILIGSQNNGLYIFKGERFVTYNSSCGLVGDLVYSIGADELENLFIGTNKGLSVLRKNESVFKNSKQINGTDFSIRALVLDRVGGVWIGTDDQKVVRYSLSENKFSVPRSLNDNITSTIVNCLTFDLSGRLWVGTGGSGLCVWDIKKNEKPKNFTVEDGFYGQEVSIHSILCDHKGILWVTVAGKGLAQYEPDKAIGVLGSKFKLFTQKDGFASVNPTALAEDVSGTVWIGTSGEGLYSYRNGSFRQYKIADGLASDLICLISADTQNNIWIGTNKGLSKFVQQDSVFISYGKNEGFKSVETEPNASFISKDGTIWFGTVNGLVRYNPLYDQMNTLETKTSITGIKVNYVNELSLQESQVLRFNENTLTFYYSGVCISNPEAVRYRVMLEGTDKEWRPASKENSVIYSSLLPGHYVFKVKASNNLGKFNEKPVTFSFSIDPPWYFTFWAYLFYLLVIAISFFMYIKWRERKLKSEKKILETRVQERTFEVLEKNKELDEKNKDILASIRYAKRIQDAILPPDEFVRRYLPKTFILFKPKDIVSGDFYWLHDKGHKILFAAVDCTGHGVPGAFMSIVGHNHLEQIVGIEGLTQPAAILDALNRSVSDTLRQSQTDDRIKDGMDIALCMFDRKTNEFQYAGAFNPLYWVRNGELREIKGDKFPIGNLVANEQKKFTNHCVQLEKGDSMYVFSDGYADQFGGPAGKKLKYSTFKKLLVESLGMNMEEQGAYLAKAMEEWKGGLEQVDDILVIGTRL